jgi:hypothetical protein
MAIPRTKLNISLKVSVGIAFCLTFFPALGITFAVTAIGLSEFVGLLAAGGVHASVMGKRWFAIGYHAFDSYLAFTFFGITGVAIGGEIGKGINAVWLR